MRAIEKAAFPVLLAEDDSYGVALRVHSLIVKTRAADTEKISVIRDLIGAHVDVNKILRAL
jgi:BioD-like phosphotransacetylase family protein